MEDTYPEHGFYGSQTSQKNTSDTASVRSAEINTEARSEAVERTDNQPIQSPKNPITSSF